MTTNKIGAKGLAIEINKVVRKGGCKIGNKKLLRLGKSHIKTKASLTISKIVSMIGKHTGDNVLAYEAKSYVMFYNGSHLVKHFSNNYEN